MYTDCKKKMLIGRQGNTSAAGLWIKHDPEQEPDVVVYYIHGMWNSQHPGY